MDCQSVPYSPWTTSSKNQKLAKCRNEKQCSIMRVQEESSMWAVFIVCFSRHQSIPSLQWWMLCLCSQQAENAPVLLQNYICEGWSWHLLSLCIKNYFFLALCIRSGLPIRTKRYCCKNHGTDIYLTKRRRWMVLNWWFCLDCSVQRLLIWSLMKSGACLSSLNFSIQNQWLFLRALPGGGLYPQEKPLIGIANCGSDPRRQEGRKPGIIMLPNSKALQEGSFWVWQSVQ